MLFVSDWRESICFNSRYLSVLNYVNHRFNVTKAWNPDTVRAWIAVINAEVWRQSMDMRPSTSSNFSIMCNIYFAISLEVKPVRICRVVRTGGVTHHIRVLCIDSERWAGARLPGRRAGKTISRSTVAFRKRKYTEILVGSKFWKGSKNIFGVWRYLILTEKGLFNK